MTRDGRLGVGIIGAGRVGPVLGAALAGAGHAITGISASTDDERERAASILPGAPHLEVPAIVERSELVILAVPDDQLPGLVSGLASLGVWQPGQLVLHTSAAHGVRVLDPARPAGIIPLAVHPALSFTGTSIDLARLREAWCAVTAPSPVLPIAQALVVEMGAEPIVVSEEHRAAYADAIQSASDFSTAIVSQAMGALRDIGVDEPGRVLGAVVRSAVENALRSATVDSIDLAALADRGADAHAEPDPRDDRPDPLDRPDPGAA
ncbi:Rossmann-like and DUF2520 domain-containing protein [Microcella alkalica]|uniref:Rossmann-like and DUF2520 domain-containing protein n=1 Tax=Microcella alkalica TaxID=355930 RepID=UPI00145DDA57|nr:Rossmann-like and DUF2520 domain-containing protein [Microcella alkalica]